ncbi:MAG: ABC transporter permease subunit [Saccharofermentans sp.]|nr:ABC transporter permease subunit [Saccharofermentans sp.]
MARGAKNNGGHKGLSYTKFGYIFIAPFCIVYLIFSLYPLLTTFWYSVANPKSNTADFWGFSNKDVFYDQYLNLMDTSLYPDEEAFTAATGITYDEYKLVKDYFTVQEAATKYEVLDEDNLQAILDIGTKDNGSGVTLSQDTLNVIQQVKNDKSILPLTESYMANPEDNAYTNLVDWKGSFSDPQIYTQDTLRSLYSDLDAIVHPATASDDSVGEEEVIDQSTLTAMSGFQGIIDALDGELTAEQQAIVDDIAKTIGEDDLKAYFESVLAGDNSVDDPMFYYAVRNLNTASGSSAYGYTNELGIDVTGVFEINSTFITKLNTYLTKNVWPNTIVSLKTFESMEAYAQGEKSVFTDKTAIMADFEIINKSGIAVLKSYTVEGSEITERASTNYSREEAITTLQSLIDSNKESDPALIAGASALGNIKGYYQEVVQSTDNTTSVVDHVKNVKDIYVEKYVSFDGKLDVNQYLNYKKDIGLTDVLSLANYEKLDATMKEDNRNQARAILATTYQDPEVANYGGKVSTYSLNKDGELYFDVDVRNGGSDEVVIVGGNTLQEQLDFITPYYEQHLINDADIIEGATTDEIRDGIKGMGGTDRFDINEAYSFVKFRMINAERQINNPSGILDKVDSTKEYIMTGGDNFKYIFTDSTTRNTVFGAFATTATLWIMGFVPQILLALILSNWFTDNRLKLKGLSLMKALMYLPNVITAVTIAVFFRRIFSYASGGSLSASQIILRKLTGHGYNFFTNPWASRWLVAFINFWMWYGNTMITLIAGITSINESLFESAQIDGANSFQTYTKITLPLLRPMLLYTFVSSLIGGLQMYDIPKNIINTSAFINFNGTQIYSLRTVLMYVNEIAFGAGNNKLIGRASAVSVILFIVTTILSIIIFYLMRDKDAAKAAKAKRLARKAVK